MHTCKPRSTGQDLVPQSSSWMKDHMASLSISEYKCHDTRCGLHGPRPWGIKTAF